VKTLAIFLSFLIAGFGVSAALATAAPPVPNSAAVATSSAKTRRATKTRSASAHKSGRASLKTIAARKRHYRRRYYSRRYRYRGPLHPSHQRVSEIQSALVRSGYYKGEPNGKWDASTISAMRNFQEDHGLDGTGKIDALSLQKLGLGSEIAGVDAPHQPVPQAALPNGQSAPAAVPNAKPQTPQIPQTPKAPDTGSGTSSPAGNSTATPSTSSDSSSSKTVSLR
jgi:hypothetical protein